MRSITWSSTAATASSTAPAGGVSARELDELVAAWTAALDKGAFICSLPLHQAQALCAVARERLPAPEPRRGNPPQPKADYDLSGPLIQSSFLV